MKKTLFYILSALTLMFIGLKLADKIDWSWWWVFSPVWIPLIVLVLVTIVRLCTMYYLYKHNTEYRKAVDDYREASKQSKMTLADRLKEMKEHALKMQEQRAKFERKEE